MRVILRIRYIYVYSINIYIINIHTYRNACAISKALNIAKHFQFFVPLLCC